MQRQHFFTYQKPKSVPRFLSRTPLLSKFDNSMILLYIPLLGRTAISRHDDAYYPRDRQVRRNGPVRFRLQASPAQLYPQFPSDGTAEMK